uniref:Maturase K n=1 Tax=Dracunculus medinensis TaxID=318479 RepID=A0A0N4UQI5_DRAME
LSYINRSTFSPRNHISSVYEFFYRRSWVEYSW